jgi:hypothetical protein
VDTGARGSGQATEWSEAAELQIALAGGVDPAHPYRLEGLEGFAGAAARIVPGGSPRPAGPYLGLRPLTAPPGAFDLRGILFVTPFVEVPGSRLRLVEFERRIGRRYYEFMAAARFRYAAACGVEAVGVDLAATCAEVYAIDAATRAEAEALDASTSPEPQDILDFYRECSALKVPGSGRRLWLLPRVGMQAQ